MTETVREFRRQHRDDWHKTKEILGESLVFDIENATAPAYYAWIIQYKCLLLVVLIFLIWVINCVWLFWRINRFIGYDFEADRTFSVFGFLGLSQYLTHVLSAFNVGEYRRRACNLEEEGENEFFSPNNARGQKIRE